MLFNSPEFFVFFALIYIWYRLLPFRWQNLLLLVAGYIFYGAWDVRFLFLIAFSTTVDFLIGLLLTNAEIPKRQQRIALLFLIGAASVFLCVDWSALGLHGARAELPRLLRPRVMGLYVLAGVIAFALLARQFIRRLASLSDATRRRTLIVCSVVVNLTFLGIFKYFNFFIEGAEDLLSKVGVQSSGLHLSVILPVGISFYTFQSLSYTIDVYRRRITATSRFFDFALFVAYFPPMVAGPIERARHLLPQLTRPRRIRLIQSLDGVTLILLGLFKKVAIADGIAPAVNTVFNSPGSVSQGDVAIASVLFAVQIFCDFSGYSDIARGVSKLLGIELILNFNLPYFSRNPSEFWRRWHISLSSWLRDYLYIPLGGNQAGPTRTYVNLLITMLLGGLWHGAAWNFILWGGYQGILLCGHRLLTHRKDSSLPTYTVTQSSAISRMGKSFGRRLAPRWIGTPLSITVFFGFCCYGWLLFRAHSFHQIRIFTGSLLGFGPHVTSVISKPTTSAILGMPLLILTQFSDYFSGQLESFRAWPAPLQGLLYASVVFVLIMGTSNAPIQFIYFQF